MFGRAHSVPTDGTEEKDRIEEAIWRGYLYCQVINRRKLMSLGMVPMVVMKINTRNDKLQYNTSLRGVGR